MKRILTITILAIAFGTGWLRPLGAQTPDPTGVRLESRVTIIFSNWSDGSVTAWLVDEITYPEDNAATQAKILDYVTKAHAALSGTVVP